MDASCVSLEYKCGCKLKQWWKIRFYSTRHSTDIGFDKLPQFDGTADLEVMEDEAHITAFIMSRYSNFRRMHRVDLEKLIRLKIPNLKGAYWEQHKNGEVISTYYKLD